MIKLDVKLTLPDNTRVFCGEIVTTPPDPRGMIQGAFRYVPGYFKHPAAFSLDPVNLPLSSRLFQVSGRANKKQSNINKTIARNEK